jgi:hypothetical protein
VSDLQEINDQIKRLTRMVEAVAHCEATEEPEEYACVARHPEERFYISLNRGSLCKWRVLDRKVGGRRYIAMFREYEHAEQYVERMNTSLAAKGERADG